MTSLILRAVVLLGWVAAPCASAQAQHVDVLPVSGPRLFAATTDDASSGAIVELLAHTRPGVELLAPTTGARHLRRFGKQLYAALFRAIQGEDVHRALAGITEGNPGSLALHERFGFRPLGVFSQVGRKFGRYWDVVWLEKAL